MLEPREIKLALTWNLAPYWQAYTVLKVLCTLLEEKSSHQSVPLAVNPMSQSKTGLVRYNAIVVQTSKE